MTTFQIESNECSRERKAIRDTSGTALGEPESLRVAIGFDDVVEKKRVFDWLCAGLRPNRPGRLQQEHPLLFRSDASVFHLTLYRGSRPIAFTTLWAVRYRIGVDRLRVGLISLVYTDPTVRGQGHGRRIVEAAVAHARKLKLSIAMLWSDLDDFYQRLGFARAGLETLLIVDRPIVDRALSSAPKEGLEGVEDLRIDVPDVADWDAIERMRSNRDSQLVLDPGDLTRLRSIPDMSVKIAKRGADVVAFAIRGRGDDLAEVIHEWGGSTDAALLCCRALLDEVEPENELFVLSPSARSDFSWRLRQAAAHVVRKHVAWIRIACAEALAEDLSRMLPDCTELQLTLQGTDSEDDISVELRTSEGSTTVEPSILLAQLMGATEAPRDDRTLCQLRALLGETTLRKLPLPFFVWGLESI